MVLDGVRRCPKIGALSSAVLLCSLGSWTQVCRIRIGVNRGAGTSGVVTIPNFSTGQVVFPGDIQNLVQHGAVCGHLKLFKF